MVTLAKNNLDEILNNFSDRIFNQKFIEKLNQEMNPASKLIGQYLPNPNADWVKEAVRNDPKFAQGVGSNPNLNLDEEWVKKEVEKDPNSWFAKGVGSNPNFDTLKKFNVLFNIISDHRIAEGYASNPNLNLNDEWVKANINQRRNTKFARGLGSNPNLNPNDEWVQEEVEKNPRSLFAEGVGSNPKLNPNDKWVQKVLEKDLNSAFAMGVGSNPNLNPNDEWVKEKLENKPNSFFIKFGFNKNPHVQLKLILANDLDEIHTALKSKPDHPLNKMLAV